MNQLTLSGKPSPQTSTTQALTPETTASPKLSQEKHYTEEYLLKLIATDIYIFDIRCWRNGITKQEFFKKWNNGFSGSSFADRDGDWWNAGHFAHILRDLKTANATDPEVIWQAFLAHKDEHLKAHVRNWKKDAEWEYKVASNARRIEDCEQRLFYARRCWEDMNRCLRETGQPEVPGPQGWSSAYPDPMYWGETIDEKQERKKNYRIPGGQES
jgi:hypothetical protein